MKRGQSLPFSDLNPEFEAWERQNPHYNAENPFGLEEWIKGTGSHAALAGYATILWPDFVEHDGCIFIRDFSGEFPKERYEEVLANYEGDKTAVEGLWNQRHILDLFGRTFRKQDEPSRELVAYVADLLEDMWQTKVNRDFPSRKIVVEIYGQESNDLDDYQIVFCQERSKQ
jgi:hypothetical protein